MAPNAELPIASATKMMTALVTLQHVRHLDRVFTAPDFYASSADSQIGLVPGDRMTVHDLMLALMLPSADDAAEDLAYNVGGHSVGRFVGMMNAEGRALGLHHTHYTTPIGLDTAGNYSSATDLVKLASSTSASAQPVPRRGSSRARAPILDTGPVRYVVKAATTCRSAQLPVDPRGQDRPPHVWTPGMACVVAAARRTGKTQLSADLGTSSEAARDANSLALLDLRGVRQLSHGDDRPRRPGDGWGPGQGSGGRARGS